MGSAVGWTRSGAKLSGICPGIRTHTHIYNHIGALTSISTLYTAAPYRPALFFFLSLAISLYFLPAPDAALCNRRRGSRHFEWNGPPLSVPSPKSAAATPPSLPPPGALNSSWNLYI